MADGIVCHCPRCSDAPWQTYTEAYRHQCEVQSVVALQDRVARKAYLALVAEKRGAAAAERLRQDAIALWRAGDVATGGE